MSGIGPQPGASQVVGGSTLPSSPTVRQIFCVPGTGIFVCLVAGTWTLLSAGSSGTVSGSGVTTRLTRWIDGTGSVLGDSGVADDGTNILSLRPFAVGYGLSTPAALLAGPRISAASTISTSPRGILSAQFSSDTSGARVGFQKARGTLGTPTTIVTGDTIGRLMFRGYDGTSYLEMGSIEVVSVGTIGTNRVPTKIVLATATDAATSVLTDALTIDQTQTGIFSKLVTVGVGNTSSAATDLLINPTTKASGNLIAAQVNSSNQFLVSSGGNVGAGGTAIVGLGFEAYNTAASGLASNRFAGSVVNGRTINISGNLGGNVPGILMSSDSQFAWSSVAQSGSADGANLGNRDTNISRNAAGIVQFGTTAANASGAFLGGRVVTAKTTDFLVTIASNGTFFTNTGAAGTVIFTLPTATVGQTYEFYRDANFTVQVTAGASTTIRVGASVSTSAGNVTLDAVGSRIRLVAISTTQWVGDVSGSATFN